MDYINEKKMRNIFFFYNYNLYIIKYVYIIKKIVFNIII